MKKILIATHGTLASGTKSTIELLVGNMADITCINAYVDGGEDLLESIAKFFDSVRPEEQVFVFTDILGGSVNQKIVKYESRLNVFIIAGFNLPLILTVLMETETVTKERLNDIIEECRSQMNLVEIGVSDKNNESDEDFLEG
ncbi:PTS fructose transporter subunit IIA [Clostridium chromiireducens]|uniref:PTS fructose transporter subunit IIA n=1 Tax=Clostridium chromiireducens TaxID=225345 RepID=A0A399IHC7_9CLOT|nr:PTS fructose transporter subunit IIA [Clostridium chromiireducens]RII32310.1 PTS fructose transporter subunit IIA [Clostridium chromiireducens]